MEINLEKIDQIRDRTGSSYKEAKEALELANGNVVDAIILIEEKNNIKWTENLSGAGNEVLDKLKEIIKKGNVTKILLKREGEIIMNIPVTAGAIGAILSPPIAMAGIVAALISKTKLEIVKTNGEVVDINEMAEDTIDNVKTKVNDMKDKVNKEYDKKDDN
jgi:DNA-directed RNA polymerase subunit L